MGIDNLQPVKDAGEMQGLSNLMRTVFASWKRSYTWYLQMLIMIFFINAVVMFATLGEPGPEGGGIEDSMSLLNIMLGIWPTLSIIVMVQGAIVGEIETGTASWILSKPVTRTAFLTSKLLTSAINVTLSLLLPSAIIGYIQLVLAGLEISALGYIAAILLHWLYIMFFLTMSLMLGTIVKNRKGVMGISLMIYFVFVFGGNMIFPVEYNPSMFMAPGNTLESLMVGGPLTTPFPVIFLTICCVIFIIVMYLRFKTKEL